MRGEVHHLRFTPEEAPERRAAAFLAYQKVMEQWRSAQEHLEELQKGSWGERQKRKKEITTLKEQIRDLVKEKTKLEEIAMPQAETLRAMKTYDVKAPVKPSFEGEKPTEEKRKAA